MGIFNDPKSVLQHICDNFVNVNRKSSELMVVGEGKGIQKTSGGCYPAALYSRNILQSDKVSTARWEVTLKTKGEGLYFCMGFVNADNMDRFSNCKDIGSKKKT